MSSCCIIFRAFIFLGCFFQKKKNAKEKKAGDKRERGRIEIGKNEFIIMPLCCLHSVLIKCAVSLYSFVRSTPSFAFFFVRRQVFLCSGKINPSSAENATKFKNCNANKAFFYFLR
jgi:hypothetical protein